MEMEERWWIREWSCKFIEYVGWSGRTAFGYAFAKGNSAAIYLPKTRTCVLPVCSRWKRFVRGYMAGPSKFGGDENRDVYKFASG